MPGPHPVWTPDVALSYPANGVRRRLVRSQAECNKLNFFKKAKALYTFPHLGQGKLQRWYQVVFCGGWSLV